MNTAQLKAIKDVANSPESILKLVDAWEADLRFKKLHKKNRIELELWDVKRTGSHKVVATTFLNGVFAIHKAWGRKGYTITHVDSTGSLATGNLKSIKSAVVYLEREAKDFAEKMRGRGGDEIVFGVLSPNELNVMREAANIARGEL